jgi:acyl carrier protein
MTQLTREQIQGIFVDALSSVAPELEPAAIEPDKPLRAQVDIDSFDFLNVIVRLHERLGVDIPESDYGEFTTLNRAVDYLARRSPRLT